MSLFLLETDVDVGVGLHMILSGHLAMKPASLTVQCIICERVFVAALFSKRLHSCEGCPVSLDLKQRSAITGLSVFLFFPALPSLSLSFFLSFSTCLIERPALTLQPWQITAVAFVGRVNYTTCHVGHVAGSKAHGRFSGFNYISLADR